MSAHSQQEEAVRRLYRKLLDSWNDRDASAMANCFAEDGNLVGFDGSQINGRAEVERHLSGIFTDHVTAAYVGKVREVRFLTPDVAVLRAVSGLVPRGQSDLNPNTNAVQSLVAVKQGDTWRAALYQNTPATFHGRPDLSQALTDELRQLLPHA